MRVYVIESNDPRDFYDNRLDGLIVNNILDVLNVDHKFRYALNKKNFEKAIKEAKKMDVDPLHISCHGNKEHIALTDGSKLDWLNFVDVFNSGHLEKCRDPARSR